MVEFRIAYLNMNGASMKRAKMYKYKIASTFFSFRRHIAMKGMQWTGLLRRVGLLF